jgi:type IV pilus assembly protein PilB
MPTQASVSEALTDFPTVSFINKIIIDAVHKGASDIHFEPYEKNYRIRFRIDGILYEIEKPDILLASRLASRLKIMAGLDIAEKRLPQDGRFHHEHLSFRVSSCPTLFGEKIVLRILDPKQVVMGIEELGLEAVQKTVLLNSLSAHQGMILVTGPTGSGKTVTLYSALHRLNQAQKNISTAEDPVEIYLSGINQVQVNPKTGLTFATALRAFLRQDPDIMMVGEVRDQETADIAIKAAQTGHLVLSTLHTNSAVETVTRLVNMGIAPFNIATSLKLVIAQRLVRLLCVDCKVPYNYSQSLLKKAGLTETDLKNRVFYQAQGCKNCQEGFKGRIGIFEVLPLSEKISEAILQGGTSLDIAAMAQKEGFTTLYENGLEKVKQGLTSLEEIAPLQGDSQGDMQ